jgi:FG-GAP-like repeat
MTTNFNYVRAQRLLAGCAMVMLFASASLMAQRRSGCPPAAMGTQFADAAGDGKAAAIAISLNGVSVRRSDGRRFRRDEAWVQQPYFGTDLGGHQNIYFADVNGDGKADAIVSNTTEVAVRLSDGTQFIQHDLWTREPYFGVALEHVNNFFADVTGDGKADAIVVNPSGVTVRRSDGTKFRHNELWIQEPYLGGLGNYFADVTGDGRADAIVVNTNGIAVRRSDGERFLRNETWTTDPYFGSVGNSVYFADVNGDGKADAIVVNANEVAVRLSDGRRFLPARIWIRQAYYGSIATAFVDVDGDGKADAVVVNPSGIVVRRSDGERFLAPEEWTRNPFFGDLDSACRPDDRHNHRAR